MLGMFVIKGANIWPCQDCGLGLLSIQKGRQKCSDCGRVWDISPCFGNAFARMELEMTGKSQQTGSPYYFNGYLVKAIGGEMICKRCGTECPEREKGYCLHCQVAVDFGIGEPDKPEIKPEYQGKIFEGFPDN